MDLTELLNAVDAAVWGPPMIILLLGCHIYTTIRTKCIQRKLPLALKLSVTKDDDAEGDVSNFGAMATSLASTLGTGSIVGVATAVLSGGPGAVLWMWLTGILGMATKYTEVFAAMKYRVKDWRGEMMGGAMHVWEQRYKRADGTVPWWAKLAAIWFALLACFTIFGIGSAVQTSAITSVVQANFGWDPAIVSAFVCGTALLIILGGLQKVSSICEKLVPIMGGAVPSTAGEETVVSASGETTVIQTVCVPCGSGSGSYVTSYTTSYRTSYSGSGSGSFRFGSGSCPVGGYGLELI